MELQKQISVIGKILHRLYGGGYEDCGSDFEGNCIDSNGNTLEIGDDPSPENCASFPMCKKYWEIQKLLKELPKEPTP